MFSCVVFAVRYCRNMWSNNCIRIKQGLCIMTLPPTLAFRRSACQASFMNPELPTVFLHGLYFSLWLMKNLWQDLWCEMRSALASVDHLPQSAPSSFLNAVNHWWWACRVPPKSAAPLAVMPTAVVAPPARLSITNDSPGLQASTCRLTGCPSLFSSWRACWMVRCRYFIFPSASLVCHCLGFLQLLVSSLFFLVFCPWFFFHIQWTSAPQFLCAA